MVDGRVNTRARKPPNPTVEVEGIKIRMDTDVSRVVTMTSTNLDTEARGVMTELRHTELADKKLTAQEDRTLMGEKTHTDVALTLVKTKPSVLPGVKNLVQAGVGVTRLEELVPMAVAQTPGGAKQVPHRNITQVIKVGDTGMTMTATGMARVVTEVSLSPIITFSPFNLHLNPR